MTTEQTKRKMARFILRINGDGERAARPKQCLTRAEILDKAKACVCGQREEDYGSPEDNFQLIADLWAAYLTRTCVPLESTVDMGPKDVAMMMALLKIARIAGSLEGGTADSYIDLAGYAACGGECAGIVSENPAEG